MLLLYARHLLAAGDFVGDQQRPGLAVVACRCLFSGIAPVEQTLADVVIFDTANSTTRNGRFNSL